MQVYVDKPRALTMSNGSKALSFTAVFYDEAGIRMVFPGFRLMSGDQGGVFFAPSFRLGKKGDWYPIVYLGPQEIIALWQAFTSVAWAEKYQIPLAPFDAAVAKLVFDTDVAKKIAPGLLQGASV